MDPNPSESQQVPQTKTRTRLQYLLVGGLTIALISFGLAFILTLLKPEIGNSPIWAKPVVKILAISFFGGSVTAVVAAIRMVRWL